MRKNLWKDRHLARRRNDPDRDRPLYLAMVLCQVRQPMSFEFNDVIDLRGYIVPDALIEKLHITKQDFAVAVGIQPEALIRKERRESVATQQRLRQLLVILKRIEPWAGSLSAAWSWYRAYPIAPLGGLTAEELVFHGRANDVWVYLSHIAEGGHA